MRKILLLISILLVTSALRAQAYLDSSLSPSERAQDLLGRMTPGEKFRQLFMVSGDPAADSNLYRQGLFGVQSGATAISSGAGNQLLQYHDSSAASLHASNLNRIQSGYIESGRLGIPIIAFDEALHGLVRADATVFPQSIALAATWNPKLMSDVASAIAMECGSRGIRQVLSPVLNIATDVRWGRTEETYGEDPFLAACMGLAYVRAFESRGIIATPKHFLANVGDGGRDSYPIHLNERLLREIHLPPFETCIREGGARSIMTAYNSLDGTPCTSNSWLLRDLLRREWGFSGFVISDAGGTGGANVLHMTARDYPGSTRQSIEGGLDVIFQTSFAHDTLFMSPFLDGSIDPRLIDSAVFHVLKAKFELGLFEAAYSDPGKADSINHCPAHVELAREASRQSIVLLKNLNDVLPLSNAVREITVIGVDAVEARLGGYSGPGEARVSILDGMRRQSPPGTEITYSKGCVRSPALFFPVPSSSLRCDFNGRQESGLRAEYFANASLSGSPAIVRVDQMVDFRWTLFSPDPERLGQGFYSVRWTGKIVAPESGVFRIGIDGNDGYRFYLDDRLLIDNSVPGSRKLSMTEFKFRKGQEYNVRIEYSEPRGNAWFRLVWSIGAENEDKTIREAVRSAASSDLALVVVGIEEGEFLDRSWLGLPGRQEELIRRIAATGTPVVVVLVGGSAITMDPWIDDVDAVLDVWYPGEQGGNAIADVIFGRYNPAGRLPVSFPRSVGQLPLVYNHKPTGRGDDYIDGSGMPLFPFGFGLSYTQFIYDSLSLTQGSMSRTDSCRLSVRVTNVGKMAGDEVVQLYLRDEIASVSRPVIELKGFERVHLAAGESKLVEFVLTPQMLQMFDKNMNLLVEPGAFRLMLGASSRDIRLQTTLTVE